MGKDKSFLGRIWILCFDDYLSNCTYACTNSPEGEGYQTGMEPQLATAGGIGVSDELDEEIQKISYEEQSEVKKQIEKFVKEKPESVAQLLRNWLSDEWD